jgi:multicomponent Na+:H+ antiporter subunit B
MKAYWLPGFELPLLGSVHLGTPLIFDIGVYLTVIGFILLLAGTMAEDMEEEIQ